MIVILRTAPEIAVHGRLNNINDFSTCFYPTFYTIAEEEKKKKEEAKLEAVTATERFSSVMMRLKDLREVTVAREDGLNNVISELEAKVKLQAENELKLKFDIFELNSTTSKLRKGEGVDWDMVIKAEDFAPVHDILFTLAMKSAKDSVQTEYPDLKLDFLVVDDDEEVEDTQSGIANLGAEGYKIVPTNEETVDQDYAKKDETKKGRDKVDTQLLKK